AQDGADAGGGGAAADERVDRIALMLLARLLVELALRARAARRARDHEIEPLLITGLLEEVVRAEPQRANRVRDRAVAGEENPFAATAALTHVGQQVERIAVRQMHVRHHDQRRQLVVQPRPPPRRRRQPGGQRPPAAPRQGRPRGPPPTRRDESAAPTRFRADSRLRSATACPTSRSGATSSRSRGDGGLPNAAATMSASA